jgi:branched-chain amino acid transport system ATP-binding protein
MSNVMFEFRNVDVFYGPIQALQKVSLQVNEGETVALIGANGAGKSTLLMSIFGQPRISGGQILFRGEDISQRLPITLPATVSPRRRRGDGCFRT